MKKISLFICFLTGFHSVFAAGLSGKFTIDKTGSGLKNYSSFSSAVQALRDSGVSGPVIFNVADGNYEEKITIRTIKGTSDSNTITFQSASKDSSKVILRNNKAGTSAAPGYVLRLDSVAHVIFNQVSFQNYSTLGTTSAYDHVLVMDNFADSSTFSNCSFSGPLNINSTVSSSSSVIYSGMYSYGFTRNAGNTFRNNLISGNYYGIYWYGYPNSAIEKGNVFDHNIIDSVGGYGIYTFYQDSIFMTGNTILLRNGGQGIYFLNFGTKMSCASMISNNFISVGPNKTTTNYGINCQVVDSAAVVYNNVNIYGAGAGGSYAFNIWDYLSTSYITIQNNNFINWNTGAVDYAIYATFFSSEDYNNVKSGGKYPIYFNNTNYSSLIAWRASSYGGLNDVSVNPLYSTNFDLHVHNPILNASASPLASTPMDIDFQIRNLFTPDIGADEFSPPAISASVAAITNPTLGFCTGSNDVFVTLFNNGVNTITSANIVWSVNDTLQTTFSWSGSLPSGTSASIKVGSYNFSSAINYYKIKAHVDSANGVFIAKSAFSDDSVSVRAGISGGTYTIDKSGSGLTNFASFRAAAKVLNEKGICGAVIFNVADGTYNESVELDAIPNTSATNTITFQSKSLDSTKVILDTTWGNKDYSQPGYTIKVNRCSYINFRLMKFKNVVPSNSYAHVIFISGGCNHLNILNNIIASNDDYSSALNYGSCIYSDVIYSDNYNNIQHNHISGAYYTVNARGCNIAPERGNTILDNLIDGSQFYGIYVSYEDSCTISGNKIFEENSLCAAGIYGTCESALLPGFPGYVFTDTLVISNNFVCITNSGGDGIFVFANLLNIYFNSVIVKGLLNYPARINEIPLPYSGTLYHTNLYNNIFANSTGGAVLSTVPAAIIGSDYNDYYTSGKTVFSHFGVSTYTNLSDWTLASGLDSNSVIGNPSFKSSSTGDLHLTKSSTPAIHRGIYISAVAKDIDGDTRTPVPCIGADETPLQKNDAGIASIDSPARGFCGGGIKYTWVSLRNYGTDTLKSVNINWSVDGVTRQKVKWSGSLNSGVRTLVKLDTFTFVSGKVSLFRAWTDSPNVGVDDYDYNDTFSRKMGAPLSGTYTIGGTKPDFSTFSAATDALRNVGVCGPVIFNIRDGSYKEQIIIHSILGSSPANPITFQSQSLDSTKVTLETSSNNGLDKTHGYVLCLDGSSYITVRKMTIKNTWSGAYNYADAVLVENGALNCTFENNILISPASDNVGYTFDADQYSPENNIVVRNNIIKGGIYGISFKNYLFSIGLGFQSGNVAENNIVTGSVYQGILFYGQTNLSIVNNKVNLKDAKIGIYSSWNIDGIIVNNFVCMQGNTGIALRVDNTMSVDFYYNTLINNSTKDEAAWFFYPPSGCAQYFENNIVVNMGKGGALIMEKGSFLTSDYNDIYSAGSQLATWSQSNKLYACKTLADYQTTSGGYDLNSINADPNVSSVSSGDLHLTSSSTAVLKKGTPVYGVTDDIDGDYRPAKPDIGADQYSLDSNDIGISAIVSPTDFSCGTKSTSVGLLIKNYGYYPAVNFKVGIKIGGNYSDSLTYLFKDTLHGKSIKTGAHDTVIYLTFSPALNTSKGGSVDITAYTSFATDSNQWNDTVNASYSFYPSPRAAFGAKNICIGDSTKFKDISKAAGVPIVNYFWSFGNGDSSKNNRNPVELFKVSGTYNVHEIVTDLNGCTDTARQSIKIDSVDARFKYSGSSGGNINFAALDTISVKTYIWNFGDKSSPGNGSKITHPYASNGTYLVTLTKTNTSGCVASWSDSVAEVITGIETGNDLFDVSVYPNPFKFSTNIAYSLPAAGNVRIELFDMPGKRIKLLTDERQVAGEHELRFESGENYIGLYILKMTMGELTITKKIVILK